MWGTQPWVDYSKAPTNGRHRPSNRSRPIELPLDQFSSTLVEHRDTYVLESCTVEEASETIRQKCRAV